MHHASQTKISLLLLFLTDTCKRLDSLNNLQINLLLIIISNLVVNPYQ